MALLIFSQCVTFCRFYIKCNLFNSDHVPNYLCSRNPQIIFYHSYLIIGSLSLCKRRITRNYFYNRSSALAKTRDKRVTEIDYNLLYAIFSTACSIVYTYCTRPISKHLYSGLFKDPLDKKHKMFKNRLNF